jgi:hypothetical protein
MAEVFSPIDAGASETEGVLVFFLEVLLFCDGVLLVFFIKGDKYTTFRRTQLASR